MKTSLPKSLKNLSFEEFEQLVNIGFCQPKFYKRSVWIKAKMIMDNVICANDLAMPYDFGRGKGKYESQLSISDVISKGWEIYHEQ